MAIRKKSFSVHTSILFFIGAMFGLGLLVVLYQGVMGSTDFRAKASYRLGEITYKQWEFAGNGAEGWRPQGFTSAKVTGGAYALTVGKTPVNLGITNNTVNTSLNQGIKYIKLAFAIDGTAEKSTSGPVRIIDDTMKPITPSNKQDVQGSAEGDELARVVPAKNRQMIIEVEYKTSKKNVWEKPIKLTLVPVVDVTRPKNWTKPVEQAPSIIPSPAATPEMPPQIVEYIGQFPQGGNVMIRKMRINYLSGLKAGETIRLDYIRLTGIPYTIQPTVTGGPILETPTPRGQQYTCPETEWINCMPMIGDSTERGFSCSKDYILWAQANCSEFKGAAY